MEKNNQNELDKLKNLKEIADKYGVNMYEKYPVSDDECEGEWEEVE